NVMPWLLPLALALFWLTTYRKAMAMPPLWNLRAATLHSGTLLAFVTPVAGGAAWMGSREARRHTTDLVTTTGQARSARLLATWAATTGWAMAGYLVCLAALYGVTAQQAAWGGPLWWPAAVAAASLPALSALGFAAGTLLPSRFTTPAVGIGAFFVLALSTQPITGSQSYWQISPIVTAPWDFGPNEGVATFYHYVPDLAIAQVIFLLGLTTATLAALALPAGSGGRWLRRAAACAAVAGLLAAGTAVALAGTGKMDAQGMITIPALHDAASDRPVSYTPVCSHGPVPVCLNPAYGSYLPAVAAALQPMLNQVAGLPGAPARISQAAAFYRQGPGNSVGVGMACPSTGRTRVLRMLLPDQLGGPPMTTSQLASTVRSAAGPSIVASVIGDRPGASPAQQAVTTALLMAARVVPGHLPPSGASPAGGGARGVPPGAPGAGMQPLLGCTGTGPPLGLAPGSPSYRAAQRFAALPPSARHAWLAQHLAGLRAGRITLARLP
ncbi:MAG TPA: hypothetical protein VIX86_04140, partial [Streptosporangiaceae bacterium]